MKTFLRNNRFPLALIGVVLLAFLFPEWGGRDGPLRAGAVSKAGIMVIFLLQGLSLRTRELTAGITKGRLHLFIQGWIFLGAPVVLAPGYLILISIGQPDLASGLLFLALLPTTISSAIVFSSSAGGNTAVSIFTTTLSNLIGVFWVPLACVFLFSASGQATSDLIPPLLLTIARLILLPLVLGQVLRLVVAKRAVFIRLVPHFRSVNNTIILFIVFGAFCQSVLDDAWRGVQPATMALLFGVVLFALLVIHGAVWKSSAWVAANRADRISALFCASQKTLATGVPMAVAIFGSNGLQSPIQPGLILLPLMVYHPAQLFVAAFLIHRVRMDGAHGGTAHDD